MFLPRWGNKWPEFGWVGPEFGWVGPEFGRWGRNSEGGAGIRTFSVIFATKFLTSMMDTGLIGPFFKKTAPWLHAKSNLLFFNDESRFLALPATPEFGPPFWNSNRLRPYMIFYEINIGSPDK